MDLINIRSIDARSYKHRIPREYEVIFSCAYRSSYLSFSLNHLLKFQERKN